MHEFFRSRNTGAPAAGRGGEGGGSSATWHDGLRRGPQPSARRPPAPDAVVNLDAVAGNLYLRATRPGGKRSPTSKATTKFTRAARHAPGPGRPVEPLVVVRPEPVAWPGANTDGPSIPMLFMGQEFFEDKPWSDNPGYYHDTLIWWDGLQAGQKPMTDFLCFSQELMASLPVARTAWCRPQRVPCPRCQPRHRFSAPGAERGP